MAKLREASLPRQAQITRDIIAQQERERQVREAPPPPPPNYETKTLTITVVRGKTYNKNICLSRVSAPVEVSPPAPRAAPLPPPAAGTAQISGHVKDSKTGQTLGDVIVRLNGEQEKTGTDGRYSFRDVRPGVYRLSAEKDGYIEFQWSIRLVSKQDVSKDISITRIPAVAFKLPPGRWVPIKILPWGFEVFMPTRRKVILDPFKSLNELFVDFRDNIIPEWILVFGGTVEDYLKDIHATK